MKKLKLFLAACAAMVGLSANAQGWTGQSPADGDFYLYNVGSGTFLSCGSEYWGSKACIDNGALNFTFAGNGEGAYTLYTTSTFSYGNPNTAQLQSSGYVDQSVSATTWTFNAVEGLEKTYTMLNAAGTYLVAPSDGTKSILLSNDAPTTNYGYWKLINKANLFPETASESNPADITCLIGDANFESTQDAMENFWTIVANNNNLKKGVNEGLIPNNVVESWQSSNGFTLSQTIEVPNGYYRLTAQTFCREYTATGADLPYIYLNDVKKDFNLMGTETAALGTVAGYFSNGDNGNYYTTTTDVATVSSKSITLGAKGTRTNTWNVFDNFKLYYLGPIDLSTFVTELANAVAAAEATEGTIPTAAYNAIAAVVAENNKTYEDGDAYSAAITAINNAVSTYASSEIVAAYSNYQAVRSAVLAVDGSIDVSNADALANDGTDANLDDAVAAVRTALKNYLKTTDKTNVSLTAALLVNPSFESGDFTGWTNHDMALQTNTSFGKDGNVYCEKWQPNGTFSVSQTISAMPAGVYQLTAKAKARGVTSAKLSAGGIEKAITIADSESDYTVEFAIDDNSDITIAFEGTGTGAGSSWLVVDNFRLALVSAGLPDVTAVEGKMNADVATAQTNAINAYNSDKTVANYNAASAAIAAAETSKAAYEKAATALADANALKDAHNFATAAATTTFADAIAAAQAKYDEGTLTDSEASAGANLGTVVTGWHGGNNTPAAVYLRDGFALGSDFAADPALHVNTWSTEGDTDGSNFSVPFYESWTADANNLPKSTLTGTLTDLPNGLYKVSAWVRVAAKSGVNATDAAGITMNVNNGTAVDVTEGTVIGATQRSIATYEAEGLVKDGKLTLNFNIAADANISWLAFKNVKYTKVRDLTPEEAAVVPTAIALDETEVALDATTTSKTFTLTFTPENATETVTWETSDASVATVADGVVTAVSSGTATITVKSTLDESVSASATVTVSFPETEVPEYTNDGAARYVHHYGDNIIKNGTFQYPNPFQGWKSGANGNCDANNFNIVTEDENKYIQAKQSMGAGDSHSISTGWPIEAGKTYVFGYKVKASKAGTMQFLVTSLTNSIGSETAQLDTENERKAKSVTTSWTDVKYEFTNSDNYAFVQFRARWMADSQSFDDFYLVEKTADDDVIGNVQYALDAIPNSNIGTGAFQYSQDAIDAANALEQGTATVEDVENAYAAVTTLNAPAEGQPYNIVVAEEGNAKNGNALIIVPGTVGANNPTGYGLNVNLAPNTNLNQAVTFTKVEGNKYNISFETAEGTTFLTTGSLNGSAAGWKTQQIQATTDAEKKCAFTIVASTEDNVFYIYNPEHKDYIDYQDGGALYTDTNIDHKAFSLVATSKPSITINTTAAGWGTTMLPFAVAEIPEGVKVYTCAGAEGATLTLEEVTVLEANKPYIIEGAWNATLTGDAQGTALSYTEGLLTGVYAQTPAPVGSYVLQKNDGKVGFYVVAEGKQPKVGANRAYVTRPAESEGVKAFYLGENDLPTAIQSVFDGLVDGDAYDLAGRKVQKLQKGGVYIINGKKVVVK